MTIVGIGVDLCEVARIERMLTRTPPVAQRLFTPAELEYAGSGRAAAGRLAARFAAKEAVVKALGGSVPGMTWHDAAVSAETSAPTLVVAGGALRRATELGVVRWHLSLSHDAGAAVAMVVAEG